MAARRKASGSGKRAREAFLVRLPPELLAAVKALAEQEMRSANAQVEVLLREALKRRGQRVPPPER